VRKALGLVSWNKIVIQRQDGHKRSMKTYSPRHIHALNRCEWDKSDALESPVSTGQFYLLTFCSRLRLRE
jgi:hypothetical protein